MGRVGRPHGLDGSVHVRDPGPEPLEEGRYVRVAGTARRIARRAGTDAAPIIRLEGVENREAAAALTGSELLAPLSDLAPLGANEWWAHELEGCAVQDAGRAVGRVRRLVSLPSCDVLEVEREDGGELLVPLVSDAVREVDVARRLIDVDLGFLGDG